MIVTKHIFMIHFHCLSDRRTMNWSLNHQNDFWIIILKSAINIKIDLIIRRESKYFELV